MGRAESLQYLLVVFSGGASESVGAKICIWLCACHLKDVSVCVFFFEGGGGERLAPGTARGMRDGMREWGGWGAARSRVTQRLEVHRNTRVFLWMTVVSLLAQAINNKVGRCHQ